MQPEAEAVFDCTDVKRRADLAALVELARERFGKLEVLVNNAGIGPISPLDCLRVEEWEDMIEHQHQRRALRHRRGVVGEIVVRPTAQG